MDRETIREASMALIANVLYQDCPDCGQPEPERSACNCETCKEQGALTAALRAALATPDQLEDCGGSGEVERDAFNGGLAERFKTCLGCSHPDCPNRDQGKEADDVWCDGSGHFLERDESTGYTEAVDCPGCPRCQPPADQPKGEGQ